MGKIERFEDLEVWQAGMNLCLTAYELTNSTEFSKDFALRDQVRKSAISVPSNIAEGFERDSNRQFLYFLVIAKASCGELRTQLFIAKAQHYITAELYNSLFEQCISVSKQLKGFINYLNGFFFSPNYCIPSFF
jgi:four helix bundle protein